MAQLLELLPGYDKCKVVIIKNVLQQKRKHAAHSTVPLGLHKGMA